MSASSSVVNFRPRGGVMTVVSVPAGFAVLILDARGQRFVFDDMVSAFEDAMAVAAQAARFFKIRVVPPLYPGGASEFAAPAGPLDQRASL